jgi:hypothetical protein
MTEVSVAMTSVITTLRNAGDRSRSSLPIVADSLGQAIDALVDPPGVGTATDTLASLTLG